MVAQRPPKSITVEDSFKSCTSLTAARHILRVLAPDLLARIAEEYQVPHVPPTSDGRVKVRVCGRVGIGACLAHVWQVRVGSGVRVEVRVSAPKHNGNDDMFAWCPGERAAAADPDAQVAAPQRWLRAHERVVPHARHPAAAIRWRSAGKTDPCHIH